MSLRTARRRRGADAVNYNDGGAGVEEEDRDEKREVGRCFVNPDGPDVSVPLWPLITHLIQNDHTRVTAELLARAFARYDVLRWPGGCP